MAGGKGTRVASVRADIPKPMLEVNGKPILEYQLECLARQGWTEVTLVVGHLGHVIERHFGRAWGGMELRYIVEDEPLGTAGALSYLRGEDDILLINGDLIFDVDLARFAAYHQEHGGLATVLTHPNDHPYDSTILATGDGGRVTRWLTKEEPRQWYPNRVNAGLHILSAALVNEAFPDVPERKDLDRDVLRPLVAAGTLAAYDSPEYVRDMGTPGRLAEVGEALRSGLVAARNLANPQRAAFLDRDGTINADVGFLTHIDDLRLRPGMAEYIRELNRGGYLVIVVTNQPVIARGEVTWAELEQIHWKLETLLGEQGAFVDDIFVCPHHPDKGFPGERPEYKIDCQCRKPKPGMLLAAAAKYNIDLGSSFMVGDSERDRGAAQAAGVRYLDVAADPLTVIPDLFRDLGRSPLWR
jgi:D-glycero-D-manno-heptose 1,7-bisphosphate phosphatase